MKKALKWTLIVISGLIIIVLAAAAILPVVFKDDIKAAIDKEIAKSVNADVSFEDFDVSLFKNFPNITADLKTIGVINREPFAGQVLFAAESFRVEVNLGDILFGNQLRVKGIYLSDAIVNVSVLKDGRANYDITYPSTDTVQTTEEPSEFSFGIDHWEVTNTDVTYNDKSLPFLLSVVGLNHSGSGDFSQAVFDLKTKTTADSVTVEFDGAEYVTNKHLDIDATVAISEEFSKYTFKENAAKINDFGMSFDGWFKMNEKDYEMDITFKSPDNTFKSLLSLIPGMYTESFKSIETNGELAFSGAVKGTMSDTQLPAFNINLLVKDAMFKYPDLPTAVNNINVDLLVDNKDGVIDNTVIDLKKLHLDFGSNPVDAKALITKIYPTNVDATLAAKLNLAELSKMFPLEGLEMKGNYAIDLKAKGVYDSVKQTIPSIDATMSLASGYVKSAEFPIPIEDLHFTSTVRSANGQMAETVIRVNDLSMIMEGEKFGADLLLQNLNDYTWDLNAKGGVDLEKITKVFPVEGMSLAGKLKADVHTKGKYSDLQAEKYDRLPTSGTLSLTNFKYVTTDLPTVTLSQAGMTFDPQKIELKNVDGTVGKSDFSVNGAVNNYLGYIFGKNQTLRGTMSLNSTLLDLNEFMTESEQPSVEDTTSMGVIPVPENINFILKANVKTVKVTDLTLKNAGGDVIVKDGVADLSGMRFDMLGGTFVVNGTYSTKDINHPKYDFNLKIDNVSMKDAANTSSLVRTYAPIAGLVNGKFSTDFKINGELSQDMMPNMATVSGGGLIKIAQAALTESKLISGLTAVTKLSDTDQVTMKDVLMSASIKDGKLSVKPFDVKFGNYKTTVAGSTALDGALDYTLKMDVPAGKLGAEFNNLLNKYSGSKNDPNAPIPVTIGLAGKYDNPSFKLVGTEQSKQVQDAATNAAKQEATKAIEKAVKGTEAEKIVGGILKSDTTKPDSLKTKEEKQVEGAKTLIKGLLKKKKN